MHYAYLVDLYKLFVPPSKRAVIVRDVDALYMASYIT